MRVLRVSIAAQSFLLHHLVCRRLLPNQYATEREGEFVIEMKRFWSTMPDPHPSHGDDAYWTSLDALAVQTRAFCLHSIRHLSKLFKGTLMYGTSIGGNEWIDGIGVQPLFSRIRWWLSPFLDAPTAEEGGLADFDYAAKIDDLRWIHRAVISIGWSFEALGRPEKWIAEEIRLLEEKQAAYLGTLDLSLADLASSDPSPASSTVPSLSPGASGNTSDSSGTFGFDDYSLFMSEVDQSDLPPFTGTERHSQMTPEMPSIISEEELNALLGTDFMMGLDSSFFPSDAAWM